MLKFSFSLILSCGAVLSPQDNNIGCTERTLFVSPNDTNIPIAIEDNSRIYFEKELIVIDEGLVENENNHYIDKNWNLRIIKPQEGTYYHTRKLIGHSFLKLHIKYYGGDATPATEIVNHEAASRHEDDSSSSSNTIRGLIIFIAVIVVFIAIGLAYKCLKPWLRGRAKLLDICHSEKRQNHPAKPNENVESQDSVCNIKNIPENGDSGLESLKEGNNNPPVPDDEENVEYGKPADECLNSLLRD